MRRLPVIDVAAARLVLPMADRSAAVLIEVLLSGGESSPSESLAEALALDPPFFFWTAHHCALGLRAIKPLAAAPEKNIDNHAYTAGELAAWLDQNAAAVLNWCDEGDQVVFDSCSALDENAWADRAAAAVEAAETSRLMADESSRERAYAAAIICAAERWLEHDISGTIFSSSGNIRGDCECSPSAKIRDAARSRGQTARRRWLETHAAAGILPRLASRISRLEKLQTRFDETLLAEKLEAMAEFAAGAGHEINNPLAVISGRAQLLLPGESDTERRRALALINAQARRVYEMIADMMLFARPPAPHFKPIDLTAIVDRVIGDLNAAAQERSITLARSGRREPLQIEADPEQIQAGLAALLRNSLEAIGRDGRVEIAIAAADAHAVIRISDDGPGIPPDVRRHIFDPFYSARQAGRGLGLGLSKCHRIVVDNHRGRINVENTPGQTTVFTITLPLRQKQLS